MAIAHVGASGTGAASASANSFTLATATNSFASGDFALMRVVTDNIATVDGASTDHTSISGWTGTVTKLAEQTNTVGGAAGDGATISLWLLEATGTINTGTTLTINLSGNTADKSAELRKFTKAAGQSIRIASGSTVQRTTADAASNPGSQAFSGLSSSARLYVRAIGVEGNSTTSLTNSANFTAMASVRSRNNASAVYTAGEFRINTSTGETSAPTLPTTSDSASLFLALEEYSVQTLTPTLFTNTATFYAPTVTPLTTLYDFTGASLPAGVSASGGANGTRVDSSGAIVSASAPRFDYSPTSVGTFRGLLVEPASTNYALYSQDVSNTANWGAYGRVVSTATALIEDTSTGEHKLQQLAGSVAGAGDTPRVISFEAKAGTRTKVRCELALDNNGYAEFNLSNGTVIGSGGQFGGNTPSNVTITDVGGGWYRCVMGVTMNNAGVNPGNQVYAKIMLIDGTGASNYTGDGTSGLDVRNIQLEDGLVATSYIPTTSATVTRTADAISFTLGVAQLLCFHFDDSSTQVVSVSSGSYTVPTTLDRTRIESISSSVSNATLTPALFSNSATFYAPTVGRGAVTLTPSLHTNTNAFYAPTVSVGAAILTPTLYSNGSTFYAATVGRGAVTLAPSVVTNSATFYSPGITVGAVTLTPALFTNAATFYTPTVSAGSVTLAPALLTNAAAFYSPTVTAGGVSLAPALFTNSTTFYAATVSLSSGPQTLTASLYTNTNTFYAVTVSAGAVSLAPSLLTNTNAFYMPIAAPGAVTLVPALYNNTATFHAATIIPGAVALTLPLVANDNLFPSATVVSIEPHRRYIWARGSASSSVSRTTISSAVTRTSQSRRASRGATSRR
jgi:hypothetical protein